MHLHPSIYTTHHGERPRKDGHVRLEALAVLRRHLPLPAPHQLRVALVPYVCGFDLDLVVGKGVSVALFRNVLQEERIPAYS